MIEEKYETKTYTKTEKVLVSQKRYCDHCGAEITGAYYDVRTGHFDWGNDSIDSVKNIDVCSKNCLCAVFSEYVERSDHKNNTEYIEINHEYRAGVKGDVKYD